MAGGNSARVLSESALPVVCQCLIHFKSVYRKQKKKRNTFEKRFSINHKTEPYLIHSYIDSDSTGKGQASR